MHGNCTNKKVWANNQEKKKKHNKTILLVKTKLNTIEVLNSRAFIDSYIGHDEFVLTNVLKEYDDMNEEIKNIKISTVHERF